MVTSTDQGWFVTCKALPSPTTPAQSCTPSHARDEDATNSVDYTQATPVAVSLAQRLLVVECTAAISDPEAPQPSASEVAAPNDAPKR